jgi:hypothetical protein
MLGVTAAMEDSVHATQRSPRDGIRRDDNASPCSILDRRDHGLPAERQHVEGTSSSPYVDEDSLSAKTR